MPNSDYKPQQPIKHNHKRRADFHDYSQPGMYMLTIVTYERINYLGSLVMDAEPWIRRTPLAEAIVSDEIPKISRAYPNVKVWEVGIMPDHIHMIVEVTEKFNENKNLGNMVTGFKHGCNKAFYRICDKRGTMFEKGYNDRIILGDRSVDRWKKYIRDNPRRLAMKRTHRDLFTLARNFDVCGRQCGGVGNIFLLDIPDKMAIIVHRSDDDATFEMKRKEWLACGERGGVLIGTAVAPREKQVMREAMNCGYSLIYLRNNGFSQYYKPSGEVFYACAKGQLLELSPYPYNPQKQDITRAQCMALNQLAIDMCSNGPAPIS